MSSRSPNWPERTRVRAAALLLALVAALLHGPAPALGSAPPSRAPSAGSGPAPGAAAPSPAPGGGTGTAPATGGATPSPALGGESGAAAIPLPVTAVFSGGGRTSLVVDLSASTRPDGRTVSVTRAGIPVTARLVPVLSDGLGVVLVVDTSAAGGATLPAWLSAAARFSLEAPAGTQAVVITDRAPASVLTGPHRGPIEIVRALDSIRPSGDRDTAAALTLANEQFAAAPAGRRVVVLYTTAPDAGGVSAAELGARFRARGTLLVVVGIADATRYWSQVAAATGGFFAPAGNPVLVPALDQVRTTLSGRYLIEFPSPPALPARVSVRVGTGDLTMTGDVVIAPPPAASSPGEPGTRWALLWALGAAGLLAAMTAVALLLVRRRSRDAGRARPGRRAADPSPPVSPSSATEPPPVGKRRAFSEPWAERSPAAEIGPGSRPRPAAATGPAAGEGTAAATGPAAGTQPAAGAEPAAATEPAAGSRPEPSPAVEALPSSRREPSRAAGTVSGAAGAPPIARGRVAMPPAVARGRATVPHTSGPPGPLASAEDRAPAAPATEAERD